MKVDGGISANLHETIASAKDVEAAGYSGAWTAETSHDPFLPLLLAAEHTQKIELGTSTMMARFYDGTLTHHCNQRPRIWHDKHLFLVLQSDF